MVETMNTISAFITYHASELILGFFVLTVLTALVLLIVLTRRKPEDAIADLQKDVIALMNEQQRLKVSLEMRLPPIGRKRLKAPGRRDRNLVQP